MHLNELKVQRKKIAAKVGGPVALGKNVVFSENPVKSWEITGYFTRPIKGR